MVVAALATNVDRRANHRHACRLECAATGVMTASGSMAPMMASLAWLVAMVVWQAVTTMQGWGQPQVHRPAGMAGAVRESQGPVVFGRGRVLA
jgi:hypothetical protein